MGRKMQMLVADLGGTKTDVALALPSAEGFFFKERRRFNNDDFSDPLTLFSRYLSAINTTPEIACFAIAGIVGERVTQMTNRPWSIDAESFEQVLGVKQLVMINDLTAFSSSVAVLPPEAFWTLQDGHGGNDPVCGILAPGTGLGEGMLLRGEGFFFARGSEGGHTDFGPQGEVQERLLRWTLGEMKHVSYEAFLCGSGLIRIFRFVTEELGIIPQAEVLTALQRGGDHAPIITSGAFAHCPACCEALSLFLDILGSEAGNLALKLLAKGGIFLGGGILPRLYRDLDFSGFLRNFKAKGKMSSLMEEFPISLILADDANLQGCASYASRFFSHE